MLLREEDGKGIVGWFSLRHIVTLSPTFTDKKPDGGYFLTFINGFHLDISAKKAQEVLDVLSPGEKLPVPKYPDVTSDRPQPVRYTIKEGGYWHEWTDSMVAPSVHAIEFDNGWIFDTVNGWRR